MEKETFINYPYSQYGEMLPYERYKLYTWIISNNIKNILEVGSGSGASTFYMASALKDAKNGGIVYTCDPGRRPPQELLNTFDNIQYFECDSNSLISKIISENIEIDYIFFDGPEEPELAMKDILRLEPHIKDGCFFTMHDWENVKRNYDGGCSIKSAQIKPYMETSEKWEEIEVLSGIRPNSDYYVFHDRNTDSVGLPLYKYHKPQI